MFDVSETAILNLIRGKFGTKWQVIDPLVEF